MLIRKLFNETVFTIYDDDYEYADEFKDIKRRLIKDNKLTLGGYTWNRIGKLQGHDLYLCDDIVRKMAFNNNSNDNIWETCDIRRWLNNNFYNKLSEDEKEIITNNRELNDNIFLLSEDEYNEFKNNITLLRRSWWLRSPGLDTDFAAYVLTDGDVYSSHVNYTNVGVRPALLV